jgi:hypothetical protein
VKEYVRQSMKGIPSSWYNATGRAYPDVAACGWCLCVWLRQVSLCVGLWLYLWLSWIGYVSGFWLSRPSLLSPHSRTLTLSCFPPSSLCCFPPPPPPSPPSPPPPTTSLSFSFSFSGRNYITVLAGSLTPVDGTSAATPTFAGVVSLMNDARLSQGKAPLGFLNPWLYQVGEDTPTAFWDITRGDNACPEDLESGTQCCEFGLSAAVGFDLVTGWGTPKFHTLVEQAMKV